MLSYWEPTAKLSGVANELAAPAPPTLTTSTQVPGYARLFNITENLYLGKNAL